MRASRERDPPHADELRRSGRRRGVDRAHGPVVGHFVRRPEVWHVFRGAAETCVVGGLGYHREPLRRVIATRGRRRIAQHTGHPVPRIVLLSMTALHS